MVFVVLAHVEVDATIGFVGVPAIENGLDHLDLFHDVAGGTGLDGRRLHVEDAHDIVKVVRVLLDNLHRLEVFESGLLADFVLSVVRVSRQVTDVRDVPNVAYLVAEERKVPVHHIERQECANVPEVHVAVHCWATNVHAHVRRIEWSEQLLFAGQTVLNVQRGKLGHVDSLVCTFVRCTKRKYKEKASRTFKRQRSANQCTADCVFFPMASSMIDVISGSSTLGSHPQSLRAAVSSMLSGQLAAMACRWSGA